MDATGVWATAVRLDADEAYALVKWKGPIVAIYNCRHVNAIEPGKPPVEARELVAYLTLKELQGLIAGMEAGPYDAPLPPPVSGPERESWKIQEGPNA